MTCNYCVHFQPTQLKEVDTRPYLGKGYTLDEILELSKDDEPQILWDCPYAFD